MTDTAADRHPIQAAVVDFDAAVDRILDRLRGKKFPDRFFYTATELGDFSLIWHLLNVARALRRNGDLAGAVRIATFLGIESAVVNGPVKALFRRARPVSDVPRPHRLRTPKTTSFPSGHSSAAAVFAVSASEDDDLAALYAALAVLVGSSRAYVRIHHASDVVGGAVVGVALARLLRVWWPAGQTLPRGIGRR